MIRAQVHQPACAHPTFPWALSLVQRELGAESGQARGGRTQCSAPTTVLAEI